MAVLLSMLSALCFGAAAVTSKVGLRSLDARAGAAISVPTATALFAVASPFALEMVAALVSGAALREEGLTLRVVAGATVTVAAVVYLIAA